MDKNTRGHSSQRREGSVPGVRSDVESGNTLDFPGGAVKMDEQLNPLDRELSLSVVLPGGLEKTAAVHGSKPVMDFLVTLCASHHLNPSDYTVEFLSHNKNNIRFKPNSPIGSLEAEKIVLKPKGMEEKIRRPYMPEPSVRLLINYNKSHKAVLRVNPKVPLEMLLPAVCEKCEFQVETSILLRDSQSEEPLDLSKSLNDHGLREVFAKDTAAELLSRAKTPERAVTPSEVISPPPIQELPKKEKKQKENTGFLSLFRRCKKKPQMEGAASAPAFPGLKLGVSGNVQSISSSSNTLSADTSKKRRAPQPPMGVSQSVPHNLSVYHLRGAQRSADSTLRSTKRRAPPPPCANNHEGHTGVKGTIDSLRTLEDLRESDESGSITISLSTSSSPHPSRSRSSSSFSCIQEAADQYLPSFRGKDLADARCALAKVLTSSISRGALVKRLKNSTSFPKSNNSSTSVSVSHRWSENGDVCTELEHALTTNLPVETDWEDLVERKVFTTFKVVPAKKPASTNAEITLSIPENITVEDYAEIEAIYEDLKDQPEAEENPTSLEESQNERSLLTPEGSSQEASGLPSYIPILLDLDKNLDCQSLVESEVWNTADRGEEVEEGDPESDEEERPDEEEREAHREDEEEQLEREDEEEQPEREDEEEQLEREDEDEQPERGEDEEEQLEREDEEEQPERGDDQEEPEQEDEKEEAEREDEVEPQEECDDAKEEQLGRENEDEDLEKEEYETVFEEVQAAEEIPIEVPKFSMDLSEVLQSRRDWLGSDTVVDSTNAEETDIEEEEDFFPPPPPPVYYNEDLDVFEEGTEAPRTLDSPSNEQVMASCGENEQLPVLPYPSAATTKTSKSRSPAPSRFAQAVAMAVQRSRIMRPNGTHPTSSRSIYQFGA